MKRTARLVLCTLMLGWLAPAQFLVPILGGGRFSPLDYPYSGWTIDCNPTQNQHPTVTATGLASGGNCADNFMTFLNSVPVPYPGVTNALGGAYKFSADMATNNGTGDFTIRIYADSTPYDGALIERKDCALTSNWANCQLMIVATADTVRAEIGGAGTWGLAKEIKVRNAAFAPMVATLPELVASGSDFSTASWTRSNVTVSNATTVTATAADSKLSQTVTVENGSMYEVSFDVKTTNSATFDVSLYTTGHRRITQTPGADWQTMTYHVLSNNTSLILYFGCFSTFSTGEVIVVRNVSVKKMS